MGDFTADLCNALILAILQEPVYQGSQDIRIAAVVGDFQYLDFFSVGEKVHIVAQYIAAAGYNGGQKIPYPRRLGIPVKPRPQNGSALLDIVGLVQFDYLLQVSVEEHWRTTWTWTHGVTASVWLVTYAVHQFCELFER